MTAKPPPLTKPVEIAKFWKNRQRRVAIVVLLRSYEGFNLIDLREHFVGADGCMKPTTKGSAMSVRRLPELAAGIMKALKRARELGLLDAAPGTRDDAS